jgi:beta-phosphoglucomutase family hydrolase
MNASGLPVVQGLALILDLDGVVVDSTPVHALAWQRYLEELGIHKEELVSRMHGRRNDEIVREFVGAHLSAMQVFEHGAAKERLYREIMAPELMVSLVPGVIQFLDRAGALPVALATNAERANVDFVLDGACLRSRFRVVIDGSQVRNAKPAPDIYLLSARRLGIAPHNCIVFEDSSVGVAAARAAGMRVVGVLTHTEPLEGADLTIRDFLDPALEPWLAAQGATRTDEGPGAVR